MDNTGFLHQVITDEGFVAANALAKVLHITQNDLADVTGLSRDSVFKSSRCKTKSTQARLRDTVGRRLGNIFSLPNIFQRRVTEKPIAIAKHRNVGHKKHAQPTTTTQ
jgi:hypothetical protein